MHFEHIPRSVLTDSDGVGSAGLMTRRCVVGEVRDQGLWAGLWPARRPGLRPCHDWEMRPLAQQQGHGLPVL